MKPETENPRGRICAVGTFDGVHQGHCHLLRTLVAEGRQRGLSPMVLTFSSHPLLLLRPGTPAPLELCTQAERRAELLRHGVELVETIEFTPEFSRMSAAEFLAMLRERYDVRALLLGFNNHIGSDRRDWRDAAELHALTGVEILSAGALDTPGLEETSSTAVRRAVSMGDMPLAHRLLGRPYSLSGTVEHGRALGRRLGFPTANLHVDSTRAVPSPGVYATDVVLPDGNVHRGVTNVGYRPTVTDQDTPGHISIETYVLDYTGDLYGRELTIRFLERLRPERKFGSLGELQAQIRLDAAQAREIAAGESGSCRD